MQQWVHATIQHPEDVDGNVQQVTKTYLIDAYTMTEADARLVAELSSQFDEFFTTSLHNAKISDVFPSFRNSEDWFKSKVIFHSVDERSGKEKEKVNNVYLQASSIQRALEILEDKFKTCLVPFTIREVAESKLSDVFFYTGPTRHRKPTNQLDLEFGEPVKPEEEEAQEVHQFRVGEEVRIIEGAHFGRTGIIKEILMDGLKASVSVDEAGSVPEVWLADCRHLNPIPA